MPARITLLMVVFVLSAWSAEQVVEEKLEGKPLSYWLAQLGAEEYGQRERASEVLGVAGEKIAPALKAFIEASDDLEVKRRGLKLLSQISVVDLRGKYHQHSHTATQSGEAVMASNDNAKGELQITAEGMVWVQNYGAHKVTQTYIFAEKTDGKVKAGTPVKLVFQKMETESKSYYPDKNNPTLLVTLTEKGPRLVFSYGDDQGISASTVFSVEPKKVDAEEVDAEDWEVEDVMPTGGGGAE